MILTNFFQPRNLCIIAVFLASHMQAAHHQKNPVAPAPYYAPSQEKQIAEITFRDITLNNVRNASKEGVKRVIENGYELPAWHWSVFYDSLIFYAQEGVHLPPLSDFPSEMQVTIKNNWLRAQKLGAHLLDRQGIAYLISKNLIINAEQWPLSERDFIYFFNCNITLPPLEDFTVERQNKIRELLAKLGKNVPKIAKPKTEKHTPSNTAQSPGMIVSARPPQAPAAQKPLTTAPALLPVYVPMRAPTQPIASPYVPSNMPSSTSSTSITPMTVQALNKPAEKRVLPESEAAYMQDYLAYLNEDYSEYDLDDNATYENYDAAADYEPTLEDRPSVNAHSSTSSTDRLFEDPRPSPSLPAQQTHRDLLMNDPTQEALTPQAWPAPIGSSSSSTDLLIIDPLPSSSSRVPQTHGDLLVYEPAPEPSSNNQTSGMSLLVIDPSPALDFDLMARFSSLNVIDTTPPPIAAISTSSTALPADGLVQSVLNLFDAPEKPVTPVKDQDLETRFLRLSHNAPTIQSSPAQKPATQQPPLKDDSDAWDEKMEQRLQALRKPLKTQEQATENSSTKKEKRVMVSE